MKNKSVHYGILVFDLSKMFKTMDIHFKISTTVAFGSER